MIGKSGRRGRPEALSDECEAFLSGGIRDREERAGRQPPPWAWLNAIAHAELGALTELAHREFDPGRAGGPSDRWAQATSFLAAELLLAGAHSRDAVHRIQVDALVPLELIWSSDTVTARSPSEFVREVRAALTRSSRAQRRQPRGGCEVEG